MRSIPAVFLYVICDSWLTSNIFIHSLNEKKRIGEREERRGERKRKGGRKIGKGRKGGRERERGETRRKNTNNYVVIVNP